MLKNWEVEIIISDIEYEWKSIVINVKGKSNL